MNVSFPGPLVDISSTVTSQSLKRSNPKNATSKSAPKPPKRRKRDDNRSFSRDLDNDEDSFSCHLSAQTRDTVLKLRKIKDPFDEDLQQVVDDVFHHIDQQPEEDVNLAESALLLSSVTHVYSTQVKTLHEEVLEIAARLTGKESPKKARGRKKKEEEQKGEIDGDGKPFEEKPQETPNSNESNNTIESGLADNNNNESGDPAIGEKTTVEEGAAVSSENPEVADKTNPAENAEGGEVKENDAANAVEVNPEQLQTEILSEIPGCTTRRQSERLKKMLNIEKEKERDYTLKKKKYDDDPPDLISCHDEWKEIMETIYSKADIDFDEILPPELEIQVGRRRKKLTINNNEMTNDDDCVACQNAESQAEEKQDEKAIKAIMSSCFDGHQYETLDHLSNDVQERFHALIQEMHKLPYDYGLLQHDMFKAYQQKFLQAVTLLSQNSVLVKRNEEEAAATETKVVAEIEIIDSQASETDKTISSIAELLNQVRQQASEEYNKGKQSKIDAEVPIGQMIATLKRIICSRYKKWHVRTDGDKAVFKRIKEFEDKVKSVLKREAEQGLFDVKKYEMEVMDVTMKESQDADSDEYFCPTSPVALQDGAVSPRSEDSKVWNLCGNSRRTSVAGSVDGSMSWIRLFDIFSHMKKIDNSETCRHFYAVLGLLSHKNLSINYDALFSQESAKLITKLLKSQKEGANQDKYPVGAKIMTSRCPDIERDDVLLAPVFNPENLQLALEQDYLSSSGYQSDSLASSSAGFSPSQPKTIQDAISEFVIDPGEPLALDNVFGTRKRKH